MRFDRGVRPATVDRVEVDVPATYGVAGRFEAAAELIDGAVGDHLTRLEFGGAVAGRAHAARGDALHAALQRVAAELARWSRACTEIAVALRAGADRYADAESYAAARIA